MSLKSRLRIAISVLMVTVVVLLSLVYVHGFLSGEFARTSDMTLSIAGQVQAAASERLDRIAKGKTPADIKRHWLEVLPTDDIIAGTLERALNNWRLMSTVYLTDANGRVLASTDPATIGHWSRPATPIEDWERHSVFENAMNLFWGRQDIERLVPLAILGEQEPFILTHVVISRPVFRESLYTPLRRLAVLLVLSLIGSVILSILLPNLVVDPLERLSERLDLMATGKYPAETGGGGPRREAKEFAAVYSKLHVLGQQYRGARENADALRTNVERLLERLEQAVFLVDPSGRMLMAGQNASKLLGVPPEALRQEMLFNIVPRESELGILLGYALQSGDPIRNRVVRAQTPNGPRMLSVSCETLIRAGGAPPIGTLITLHDAESRGEIEEELGLAARLTAISRLTRGVAHEIKNPLNAITLHLEMLRQRLAEPAPELDVISREISRLDRVVKTFLDFNRPIEPQMKLIDLSVVARDLSRLLGPQTRDRNIQVVLNVDKAALVMGDLDLLQQAVLNVITNAIEAMPNGGTLRIETLHAAGKCELSISDTGPGIPPELRDRIFNLYFSTKPQGSGIGLAMAFRFVQLHDGKLVLFTESGRGTTFRFILPEAPSTTRSAIALTESKA